MSKLGGFFCFVLFFYGVQILQRTPPQNFFPLFSKQTRNKNTFSFCEAQFHLLGSHISIIEGTLGFEAMSWRRSKLEKSKMQLIQRGLFALYYLWTSRTDAPSSKQTQVATKYKKNMVLVCKT